MILFIELEAQMLWNPRKKIFIKDQVSCLQELLEYTGGKKYFSLFGLAIGYAWGIDEMGRRLAGDIKRCCGGYLVQIIERSRGKGYG